MSTSCASRAKCSATWRRAVRAAAGPRLLTTWLALLFAASGCSEQKVDATLDVGFQKLFAPRKTPQQYMLLAVSSEDADVRRDAVAQIFQSKLYTQEWALKGFVAIALLENESQTRCVAIRALDRTSDPRAVEVALKILNHRDYPPQEVWPPGPLCRGDAALLLADWSAAGKVPEESRDQVRKTLLDHLHLDADRHTRIAAARGLGYYAAEDTVPALIDGLRDEDFAVVYECEDSLVRLTGRTQNANVSAWEQWLAENRGDVFAHAGETPESRRPPYRNGLEKVGYDTRELFRWLWPGSKD